MLSDSSVLPVRDNLFFLKLEIIFGNGEVNQLTIVHDVHVFDGVAAQLRESRGTLRILALLTNQKLILA